MKTLAKWSVADYRRMVKTGILTGRRVELLAGEIVEMSPETPIHYTTAKRGAKYLETILAGLAEVRFNGPITLTDSEPEPDIAIVRLPESNYVDRHPTAADIFWIIEVAHSGLKIDLELNARIYASAGIPEYWVLDLAQQQVTVMQNPQNNQYLDLAVFTEEGLIPLAFPDIEIRLDDLFVN